MARRSRINWLALEALSLLENPSLNENFEKRKEKRNNEIHCRFMQIRSTTPLLRTVSYRLKKNYAKLTERT
jgi:hypothetical protein